jgi:putative peptide maturation system protein
MNAITDQSQILLSFVTDLSRQNLLPEEALSNLKQLKDDFPDCALDLVWELDGASGRHCYCLLVTSDSGTLSLSATQNGVLPWSLRGGVRLDSNILVKVNGNPLTVIQAITYVDLVLNKGNLFTDLVDYGLLAAEAKHYDVPVSKEQLDTATSNYFSSRGINGVEIAAWLGQRGLTIERFRTFIEDGMRSRAVERHLASSIETASIDFTPNALGSVPVSRISVPVQLTELATEILRKHPGDDLPALTQKIAEACDFKAMLKIEFVRLLNFELVSLFPDKSDFPVGKVLVSADNGKGIEIMQVLGSSDIPGSSQMEIRRVQKAVESWYENERAKATIEWNWGKANSGMISLK